MKKKKLNVHLENPSPWCLSRYSIWTHSFCHQDDEKGTFCFKGKFFMFHKKGSTLGQNTLLLCIQCNFVRKGDFFTDFFTPHTTTACSSTFLTNWFMQRWDFNPSEGWTKDLFVFPATQVTLLNRLFFCLFLVGLRRMGLESVQSFIECTVFRRRQLRWIEGRTILKILLLPKQIPPYQDCQKVFLF